MLDPDELYDSSESYRNLLDNLGNNIEDEVIEVGSNNFIEACKYGFAVWDNIKKLMRKLKAKTVYEVQEGHATIYDLLFWASNFADELYNASRKDKAYETKEFDFCNAYVNMHRGMLDNTVRNLGNVRISLAGIYHRMGKTDEVDSLFSGWLKKEPDWGWGYIGWSDLYWGWKSINKKDYVKAEGILKKGLSISNVRDQQYIKDRIKELKK